jgi:hypothetical protein
MSLLSKYTTKRELVHRALKLIDTEMYADEHPEDATVDWSCEYLEDGLVDAAKDYLEAYGYTVTK